MSTDTAVKAPYLPAEGSSFPTRYNGPDWPTFGENIVIAALWNTQDPEATGLYTAHLLTLDPGTILDYPRYVVLAIGCEVNDDRWVVLEEHAYESIRPATEHYCRVSGDD